MSLLPRPACLGGAGVSHTLLCRLLGRVRRPSRAQATRRAPHPFPACCTSPEVSGAPAPATSTRSLKLPRLCSKCKPRPSVERAVAVHPSVGCAPRLSVEQQPPTPLPRPCVAACRAPCRGKDPPPPLTALRLGWLLPCSLATMRPVAAQRVGGSRTPSPPATRGKATSWNTVAAAAGAAGAAAASLASPPSSSALPRSCCCLCTGAHGAGARAWSAPRARCRRQPPVSKLRRHPDREPSAAGVRPLLELLNRACATLARPELL